MKPYFFDVDELPGVTMAEMMADAPEETASVMFGLFGKDLVTKTILQSDNLQVFHESALPGETVQPHRHGTLQVDFVLRGELVFGSHRVGPGMGYVIPDSLYAWRAGDEGAEWIEIHSGQPGIYTDRPARDGA